MKKVNEREQFVMLVKESEPEAYAVAVKKGLLDRILNELGFDSIDQTFDLKDGEEERNDNPEDHRDRDLECDIEFDDYGDE